MTSGAMAAAVAASVAATTVMLAIAPARADAVSDFYRGRTVTVVVGYSTGGGYDAYARVLVRHMGRHIPGNPTLIVQNMPGAGSLRAANYIYNAAPKDGATFGIFSRGMAMEPLIGLSPTQYDARKFAWIGSGAREVSVCGTWQTSPIKSWQDMLTKSFTVGGEGSGSDPDIFATVLRNVFGVKLRVVSGYPGSAEMALAIERGEVDGRCGWSWSSVKLQRPDWVRDKKVNVIVQLSLDPSPELPGVPLIGEFATTDRQRQILNLVFSRQIIARPFAAPPGIPEDRKRALRDAFDKTMEDADFLAEAKARGLEVDPVKGGEIDALMAKLYATPADVIAETKAAIGEGGR